MENTDSFTYVRGIIATDDGAKSDVFYRISKANSTLAQLSKIFNSSIIL